MATPKQRRANGEATRARILTAIKELCIEQHRPTTHREIQERAGVSMGSITHNLPRLESDGKIRRLRGMRSIEAIETVEP